MAVEMILDLNVPSAPETTDELRTLEKAIRRIVRAHDLQSRALVKASGLTAAQLIIMKAVAELGEVTSTALSEYADISAATVVTVLDNLEAGGLVARYRSGRDRRVVHARLTERGIASLTNAPTALGGDFIERFSRLTAEERRLALEAASQLADLLSGAGAYQPESSRDTLELP
jgi:DNA-binding MarR family transcriptional regulator